MQSVEQISMWEAFSYAVLFECRTKSGIASVNTNSQWSKHEACFARAIQVWLAVIHNTNVTSGERIQCSNRIELAKCLLIGFGRLLKSKDPLSLLRKCKCKIICTSHVEHGMIDITVHSHSCSYNCKLLYGLCVCMGR